MRRTVFMKCDLSRLKAEFFDDCTFDDCRGPRPAKRPAVSPTTQVTTGRLHASEPARAPAATNAGTLRP